MRYVLCQSQFYDALLLVIVCAAKPQSWRGSDTSLLSGCRLHSSTEQWGMHFARTSAAVNCPWLTVWAANSQTLHCSATSLLSGWTAILIKGCSLPGAVLQLQVIVPL